MDLSTFLAAMRRRWYVLVCLLLISAGATYWVVDRVGPTYRAEGAVLLLPPAKIRDVNGNTVPSGNPYLALGGLNQSRDILLRRLTSVSAAEAFGEQFPGVEYDATVDFATSGPIMLIGVDAKDPQQSVDGLQWLLQEADQSLLELQEPLRLAADMQITATVITSDGKAQAVRKDQTRIGVLVAGLLGAGSLLLVGLLDGLLVARRRRRPSKPARQGSAAETEDADIVQDEPEAVDPSASPREPDPAHLP